jgi:hypothetical protein
MERLKKANLSGVLGAEEFSHYSSIIDQTRNRLQSAQDELTGYTQAQREAAKAAQDSAAQQAQQERILRNYRLALIPSPTHYRLLTSSSGKFSNIRIVVRLVSSSMMPTVPKLLKPVVS